MQFNTGFKFKVRRPRCCVH